MRTLRRAVEGYGDEDGRGQVGGALYVAATGMFGGARSEDRSTGETDVVWVGWRRGRGQPTTRRCVLVAMRENTLYIYG